uniref:FTH domain-containing protein n=1 Tax=Rhabditophanes sp. KR3021 TaxID=114890 RepID=A0AC35TK48_9BILA
MKKLVSNVRLKEQLFAIISTMGLANATIHIEFRSHSQDLAELVEFYKRRYHTHFNLLCNNWTASMTTMSIHVDKSGYIYENTKLILKLIHRKIILMSMYVTNDVFNSIKFECIEEMSLEHLYSLIIMLLTKITAKRLCSIFIDPFSCELKMSQTDQFNHITEFTGFDVSKECKFITISNDIARVENGDFIMEAVEFVFHIQFEDDIQ